MMRSLRPLHVLTLLAALPISACSGDDAEEEAAQQEAVCRKDATGRLKAMCEADMWDGHSPTEADMDPMIQACLHPKCLANSSGGSVACSGSCTKAKIALKECANGVYYCDDMTSESVPSYSCDDYEKRQQDYTVACL